MSKKSGFLSGVIVGGILAATAALLLSPKSGKEIREGLKKQVNDFTEPNQDRRQLALDKKEDFLQFAQEKKSKLLDLATEKRNDFSEAFDSRKEGYVEKSSDVVSKVLEKKQQALAKLKKVVPEKSKLDDAVDWTDEKITIVLDD